MRYLFVLLMMLLWWPCLSHGAAPNLYSAEVEVADQGTEARDEGMRKALLQVLVKISGSRAPLQDPALQQALSRAASHVQRFQYRNEPLTPTRQHPDEQGVLQTSRLLMEVEFESRGVQQLLRSHGYPVWGQVRPQVLVWIGVDDGVQRQLVGADDGGLVRLVLERRAEQRGLPLRLPLLDLGDRQQVEVADIWGGFFDNLLRASQRYQTEAVLIGRLGRVGQQWEVQWTLIHEAERQHWRERGNDVEPLLALGVEESAEWLASRFAQFSGDSEGILLLRVEGVDSLADYRRVIDHLTAISGVRALRMQRINDQEMQLGIELDGGRESLQRTLAMGRVLEVQDSDSQQIRIRLRR